MKSANPQGLVDLLKDPAVIVNRAGQVVAANNAMAALIGSLGEEVCGMGAGSLIPGYEAVISGWLSAGIGMANLTRKDGISLPVRLTVEELGHDRDSSVVLVLFKGLVPRSMPLASLWPEQDISLDECLEALEPAVLLIDVDGRIIYANNKCCHLMGCDPEAMAGLDWTKVFLPRRHRARGRRHFARIVSGVAGPKEYQETGVITLQGIGRLLGWSAATTLRDRQGRVIGVLGYGLDTRERQRALEMLKDRDRLYRLVSENATDGIWTANLRGEITYMSPSMARIVGYTSDELMRIPLAQLMVPSSYEVGTGVLERQIALDTDTTLDRRRSWTMETELRRKDGSTVWVEARTSFLRDPAGRPVGIFGTTRDVTGWRQAESRLANSEQRYRTLFENSKDAILIVRRDGSLLDLNSQALSLLGYSRGDVEGLNMRLVLGSRVWLRFRRTVERYGYVRDLEMPVQRQDGSRIDGLFNFGLCRDASAQIIGYEGSIRDITEWKRLQNNLQQYMNGSTRAQEEERLRLSRDLHDGALQRVLALSLNLEEAIAAERRPYGYRVQQLEGIKERMREVAQELTWLSHSLRPSVLDHLGLVPAVQSLARDIMGTARIETEVKVKGKLRRLSADTELGLFRIVQEALTNIRKHSGADRATVSMTFTARGVRLVVRDNGRGFAVPEILGDLAGKGKLGLVGMQERAQLIEGSFEIDSKPGEGATLRVEVACAAATSPSRQACASPQRPSPPRGHPRRAPRSG